MNMKNISPLSGMKCLKKRSYESEDVANNVIAQMEKDFGRKQKAYKCRNCEAWHTFTKGAAKWKK
jgi:hypothetical protein